MDQLNLLKKFDYSDINLSVDFYPHVFPDESGKDWAKYIEQYLIELNPKTIHYNKRCCTFFGTIPVYTVKYFGKTAHRKVYPWDTIPGLMEIKEYIESICKETFTVCAIQYYKNGAVGINPHRDKEMVTGTKIAGLTFGQNRTLILTSCNGSKQYKINLGNGSLYIMNPPTNDKWTHCIPKDDTTQPRISLTFRNYI